MLLNHMPNLGGNPWYGHSSFRHFIRNKHIHGPMEMMSEFISFVFYDVLLWFGIEKCCSVEKDDMPALMLAFSLSQRKNFLGFRHVHFHFR